MYKILISVRRAEPGQQFDRVPDQAGVEVIKAQEPVMHLRCQDDLPAHLNTITQRLRACARGCRQRRRPRLTGSAQIDQFRSCPGGPATSPEARRAVWVRYGMAFDNYP